MAKIQILAAATMALAVAACDDSSASVPQTRPVRTVVAERSVGAETTSFTGQIRAKDEVSLAFRLDGRLLERTVNVGDAVSAGQVIGRIDPQIQDNDLRAARAALVAAQSTLTQKRNDYWRQQQLLTRGFASVARFDQAKQELETAQAQVDSAQAQLRTAQERMGYTELRATAAGTVTAVGAWPGEVVTAGQMVVQEALQGGRDAVFDVPTQFFRATPGDLVVQVTLADDPAITATGYVREVAPQADAATRTFRVKVAISDPPDAMRLGATVSGRIELPEAPGFKIPASALTEADGRPAVWVVDPQSLTVSLRGVAVSRYDPAAVVIAEGLDAGDIVVTAGVQTLHPGQKIQLLGAAS